MKKIILIASLLMAGGVYAETKSLWCTDNDAESAAKAVQEAPSKIRDAKQKASEVAARYGSNSADLALAQMYKRMAKNWELTQTMCLDAKWRNAEEFVFDTDGLKNAAISDVEYTTHSLCGVKVEDVRKVQLSSTPSIISFTWVNVESYGTFNYSFNVERKTLKAGYKTDRSYTCELRDLDTSDNIL